MLDPARFAEGVGGACAWTGGLGWLLAAAPADRRGEMIGAALAAAIFGILLGPVIGGIATVTGPEVVFCGVAVVAAAFAVWVLSVPGIAPGGVPGVRAVASAILSAPVLFAFWLVVLPSVLSGAFDVLIPLRLDDLGASGIGIGAAFFIAAGIEAFTAPAIGKLSDRRGRLVPIRAGLLACPIAALILPVARDGGPAHAGAGRRRAVDEPDLDAGDGAALRQRRGDRPRPRLRQRPGQPRLGGRPGDRRLGVRRLRRRDHRRHRLRA